MKSAAVLNPPQRLVQFGSIAVLTDLADGYERPLRYAAMLARWYGAGLIVAHAVAPDFFLYTPPAPLTNWPGLLDSTKIAESQARSLTARLGLYDLGPQLLIHSTGIPELVTELSERRPSLIVLATHGRTGLKKWLAGSVAEEVIRSVNVPVLVLGPEFIENSTHQIELETVLYCTDLSPLSVEALRYAAGIARDHDARLLSLYVQPHVSEGFTFNQLMDRQKLQDWLQDHAAGMAGALAGVQCSVEVGKPELKITEFARQSKASLIVMGARGLGAAAGVASHFVGGVTYDVACVATVPVLVVPHR